MIRYEFGSKVQKKIMCVPIFFTYFMTFPNSKAPANELFECAPH